MKKNKPKWKLSRVWVFLPLALLCLFVIIVGIAEGKERITKVPVLRSIDDANDSAVYEDATDTLRINSVAIVGPGGDTVRLIGLTHADSVLLASLRFGGTIYIDSARADSMINLTGRYAGGGGSGDSVWQFVRFDSARGYTDDDMVIGTITNGVAMIISTDSTISYATMYLAEADADSAFVTVNRAEVIADSRSDADSIKSIPVDITALADGYVIKYSSGTGNFYMAEDGGGGAATDSAFRLVAVDIIVSAYSDSGIWIGDTTTQTAHFDSDTIVFYVRPYLGTAGEIDSQLVTKAYADASGGGEANTASNSGNGFKLYEAKTGVDLEFKTVTGGDGITLDTGTASQVNISFDGGAAPGGELGGTWASPTIDNDALDDQYYDAESDLTGLLDDNYLGLSLRLRYAVDTDSGMVDNPWFRSGVMINLLWSDSTTYDHLVFDLDTASVFGAIGDTVANHWAEFTSDNNTEYTAGDGLTLTGTDFDILPGWTLTFSNDSLIVDLDSLEKAGFLTSQENVAVSDSAAASAAIADSALAISDDAIYSDKIVNGEVALADMAANSVDSTKIVNDGVGHEDIHSDAVDSVAIVDGSVGYEDIHAGAVSLTSHVVGTLPEANGGTGDTDLDDIVQGAGIAVANGANTIIAGNCTVAADTSWEGWKQWFGHVAWDTALVKRIAISDSLVHSNVWDTAVGVFFSDSIKVKNIVSDDSVKIVSEHVAINCAVGAGYVNIEADSTQITNDLHLHSDLKLWPADENEYAQVSPYVTKSFLIADPESYDGDTLMPIVIDNAGFPFGVEIDSVMLFAEYDTSYSVVFVEQVAAGTYSVLSTLVNSGGGFYAIEAPDTDAAIAAGSRIGIIVPSDDIDRLTVAIVFHRKAS